MRCYEPTCDVIYMEELNSARRDPPCAMYHNQSRGVLYVQFRPTVNVMEASVCAKCGGSVIEYTGVSIVQLMGFAIEYCDLIEKTTRRKRIILRTLAAFLRCVLVPASWFYLGWIIWNMITGGH